MCCFTPAYMDEGVEKGIAIFLPHDPVRGLKDLVGQLIMRPVAIYECMTQ